MPAKAAAVTAISREAAKTVTIEPDHGVDPLVVDPARRDPLVDDVGLLEEQLPGGHRGADDGDDQQHRRRGEAALDPGTDQSWKKAPGIGWLKLARGITKKLATMKTNMKRSQRRKLPVAVMATSRTAAIGTEMYSLTPK